MTDDKDCAPTSPVIKYDKAVVGDCRGPLLADGMIAEPAPSVPGSFDESNPLSGLVSPNAAADSTTMSNSDRQALAAKATRTLWVSKVGCTVQFNDALVKLMVDCGENFGDGYYATKLPVTKRTVTCEAGESTSCGECSSNEDCQIGIFTGCLSGCDRSRCVWGQCTACPAEQYCEDPEFNDSAVPPWVFSTAVSAADLETAKSPMSGDVFVAFHAVSATRQVFQKRDSDGDVEVEEDSGYRVKINPVFVAYTNGTRWITLKGAATLSGTLSESGTAHAVTCTASICTVAP